MGGKSTKLIDSFRVNVKFSHSMLSLAVAILSEEEVGKAEESKEKAAEEGAESEVEEATARVVIEVGSLSIDLTGTESEVAAKVLELGNDEAWSEALERLKEARESAIEAARAAAEEQGLPERGAAFRLLLDNCQLEKKPDQVLGAIHYLRTVEGEIDSPPRSIKGLFTDAGFTQGEIAKWNMSLYINRLREQGRVMIPHEVPDKNRYVVLTDGGKAHLDRRANE